MCVLYANIMLANMYVSKENNKILHLICWRSLMLAPATSDDAGDDCVSFNFQWLYPFSHFVCTS